MPVVLISSIPQSKWQHHNGVLLALFQAIDCLELTFIHAQQGSDKICQVRSQKSWLKTPSFLDDIITSSTMVFTDCESDMEVGLCKRHKLSWETVKSYIFIKYNAGSEILTGELQVRKKSDLWDIAYLLVKLNRRTYWEDRPLYSEVRNDPR